MKVLVVLLCGVFLFLPNLGGWDLWNPDEPRYAEIAREMLTTHQWVIPHLNGEVYYDKPPLFFAMIAGTSKVLGGLDERAARLPSAIFGLLTLLLVYILGKEMADERTGLLGALVLASSGQYFWLSRRANIDATLTFTTTLTILLFMLGYQRDKGRILLYLLAYLSMAAGVLVKLQPAVIVPALALGSYYLWRKERRFFLDPS
ncbi:MAG: glycosyltransferase family 39 protein, partial [Deltaproteobacteria bacterium]